MIGVVNIKVAPLPSVLFLAHIRPAFFMRSKYSLAGFWITSIISGSNPCSISLIFPSADIALFHKVSKKRNVAVLELP